MLKVDLMRHGEPVGGRRYRGAVDDPLSETGWLQMKSAVGDVAPWRQIITSPLRRCHDFSTYLGQKHEIPVAVENRFTEIGFGEWEGCSSKELQQRDPGCVARFYHDPVGNRPRGAEPLSDFMSRIISAWDEINDRDQDIHILIVSHAGVMRAIIAHVLGMPMENIYRLQIGNASLLSIRSDDERPPSLVLKPCN